MTPDAVKSKPMTMVSHLIMSSRNFTNSTPTAKATKARTIDDWTIRILCLLS